MKRTVKESNHTTKPGNKNKNKEEGITIGADNLDTLNKTTEEQRKRTEEEKEKAKKRAGKREAWKQECQDREGRRNNVIIKGWTVGEKLAKILVRKMIEEEAGIKIK